MHWIATYYEQNYINIIKLHKNVITELENIGIFGGYVCFIYVI